MWFEQRNVARTVRRVIGATVAVQAAAAAGVVAFDELRKRRDTPSGRFPRTPAREVRAADNRIHLYTDGERLYEQMLADIDNASESVFFESYILKGDATGKKFKDALIRAAARGVDVRVIYDKFANLVVPPSFKRFPPSIQVISFPLFSGYNPFQIRTYARDHRKILVVDSEIGFVGGYNIGLLYEETWRDTHLRIQGPEVWELANSFTDFWNSHRTKHVDPLPDKGAARWEPRVRAVANLPDHMLFPVRGTYIDAINRATTSIEITQGYFLPDNSIVEALLAAVQRGVEVKVMLPEHSNHVVADWASRALIEPLLSGGVQLFFFRHAMIHAKTMTVDGRWSTIGTTNLDRLSLTGNYEINLEIFDGGLARAMSDVFAVDSSNARPLTIEEWRGRSAISRAVERILRPLAPLL